MTTETRTYVGLTGTHALDGFNGLRIGQQYTGVPQNDGTMRVVLVGALGGTAVRMSREQWAKWFVK